MLLPGAHLAHIEPPRRIDAASYPGQREIFDALPIDHPQRSGLRNQLVSYLGQLAWSQLHQRDRLAFDTFTNITSLYDPAEVYAGQLHDATLLALARAVVSAYRPSGDVRRVIPALVVQMTLDPASASSTQELRHILDWLARISQDGGMAALRRWRALRVMERTLKIWPSPYVVQTLCDLYQRRLKALQELGPSPLLRQHPQFGFAAIRSTAYNIARAYLWVDQPREALRRLKVVLPNDNDDVMVQLLEHMQGPAADPSPMIQLASVFEESQVELSLQLCRRATIGFPAAASAFTCVGNLATRLENTTLAIAAFEVAARLEPTSAPLAEQLAGAYQRQIFRLIEAEDRQQAQQRLIELERYYQAKQLQLKQALQPPLARVYFALGYGHYNAGALSLAIAALKRATLAPPLPEALFQLATIEVKLGHGAAARRYVDTAERQLAPRSALSLYWHARASTLRAQSFEADGQPAQEHAARAEAIRSWQAWLGMELVADARAEALIYLGSNLYAQGQLAQALDALEQAIDAAPERKESYADVMALLTARGRLPEALDAYHRALGRTEVSEYLKAYCSFWVINLARRAKQQPDPLALRYVERLRGHTWYHQLAPFILGKATYEQLRPLARTPSQLAELDFYQAEQLLATGQSTLAQALWQRVVATQMLAFFEFDMAQYNLRHGAATVQVQPLERKVETVATPDD